MENSSMILHRIFRINSELEHIPDPGPHTGFIIALICCSLLVVALVGFVIYHCCKINNINAQRGHSGDEAMRIEETTSLNRN
ncbi:hypothetical protein ROHU_004485 [Labeo rohita]|uniref:Uncharacterized protein n=1 Tax=Labeo rohita TaxID=84645 RepID=A0A498LAQ7_LABRO|nr:hypothetical protein ROHU_013369 [Labeo rohita]RXN32847.1 hypothetical protein ROHU_004485 [Labeo rohita]